MHLIQLWISIGHLNTSDMFLNEASRTYAKNICVENILESKLKIITVLDSIVDIIGRTYMAIK